MNCQNPSSSHTRPPTQSATTIKPPSSQRRSYLVDDSHPHFSTPQKKMRPTRATSRGSSSPSTSPDHSNSVPLIDFSRTPSPSPYRARSSRSATQSEDEDYEPDIPSSLRPLVAAQEGPKRWRWWRSGGLGAFLFGTWAGWQVYVGILVLYVSVVSYVLVLLNRFVLWSKWHAVLIEWRVAALTVR